MKVEPETAGSKDLPRVGDVMMALELSRETVRELKLALSLAYKRIAAYAAQENHRGRAAQEALRAALDAGLRAFAGHAEDMRIEHQAVIAAERDWLLEHATPEAREAYDHMVAQIMTGPGAQDAE